MAPNRVQGLPGFKDDTTRMVALLEQIVQNTSDINQQQDITLEGANIGERTGLVPHHAISIQESADLDPDYTTADGEVEMSPGDERILAEFDHGAHAIYAVGATDLNGVQYWLEVDGEIVVGPTWGPLGTVNSPFSFVEKYGGAIPSDGRSQLKAFYPTSETGDISLVGRIHVENIPQEQ